MRFFSLSRSSRFSGKSRLAHGGPCTRARSAVQPAAVITQHSFTHSSLVQSPLQSRSWWMMGTSSVARWKVLRSISCIVRCTLRARTPHALMNIPGRFRRLKATVATIEMRLIARSSSIRKTLDGVATAHGCETGGCVEK
eukprot:scaffold126000_cov75-Phaeocystis_antarctica.AAC.2